MSFTSYPTNVMLPSTSSFKGSGKSYTMMGSHDNVETGIIPRLSDALFERIAADRNNIACQVQ